MSRVETLGISRSVLTWRRGESRIGGQGSTERECRVESDSWSSCIGCGKVLKRVEEGRVGRTKGVED